jgi:hypothetical protein
MGMRNRTDKSEARLAVRWTASRSAAVDRSSEWVHCSNDAITFVSDTTAGRRA